MSRLNNLSSPVFSASVACPRIAWCTRSIGSVVSIVLAMRRKWARMTVALRGPNWRAAASLFSITSARSCIDLRTGWVAFGVAPFSSSLARSSPSMRKSRCSSAVAYPATAFPTEPAENERSVYEPLATRDERPGDCSRATASAARRVTASSSVLIEWLTALRSSALLADPASSRSWSRRSLWKSADSVFVECCRIASVRSPGTTPSGHGWVHGCP